jgi:hypothetical protein
MGERGHERNNLSEMKNTEMKMEILNKYQILSLFTNNLKASRSGFF